MESHTRIPSMAYPIDKLGWSHPELVRRFNGLLEACWARGWFLDVISSTRSYESQKSLYVAYITGLRSSVVANPDAFAGYAPQSELLSEGGGWAVWGSMHMPQYDGYSHAIDVAIEGMQWWELHALAQQYGLYKTVPSENWHLQWWTPRDGVFDAPFLIEQEDDMTPRDLAAAIGATYNEQSGLVEVDLLSYYNPHTGESTFKKYPLASAIAYTHQELKMARANATGTILDS
jgi:hypothetical protein